MEAGGYKSYKDSSSFVRFVELPTVLAALPDVSGKAVLDLGCGWGLYTNELASRLPASLVASDISPSMIRAAKAHTRAAAVPIQFRLADSKAPSGTDEFDLILANFLLPFAKSEAELGAMARSAHAALREDGTILGFIPHCSPGLDLSRLGKFGFSCHPRAEVGAGDAVALRFYDAAGRVSLATSFHWYPPAVIFAAFASAGFADVNFEIPNVSEDGTDIFGEEYWDDMLTGPKTLLFRARK